MLPALALSLLLTGAAEPRLSYPRALTWASSTKAVDLYAGDWAFRRGATEGNPAVRTMERRIAVSMATVPLAAWAFYELEKRPGRGWRLPRYLWAAGHLAVAAHNIRAGRSAAKH